MDNFEIYRREHLHPDYIGDVTLIKSKIPDSALLVSFKQNKTEEVAHQFRSV